MQFKKPQDAKEMILRLADYFRPEEFACPCCGLYLMDDELIMALDNLRGIFGQPIGIESGYRCPQYNLKLKGAAPNSYHMKGAAVDIKIGSLNGDKLMKLLRASQEDHTSNGVKRFNGFGMGNNTFHIDIRTIPTAWTY